MNTRTLREIQMGKQAVMPMTTPTGWRIPKQPTLTVDGKTMTVSEVRSWLQSILVRG